MATTSDKAARVKAQPISDPIIREQYPTGNLYDIAAQLTTATGLGWTATQIHNRAKHFDLRRSVDQRMFPPALGIARPPKVLHLERAAIISCAHIPFHDRDLLADLCRVARRDKLKTLVSAGDFVDNACFSKFEPDAPVVTWDQQQKTTNGVLYELSQTFEEIEILPGNHERRVLHLLKGQMAWSEIVAGWDICDILGEEHRPSVTDIPLVYIDDWGAICHPDSYSRVAGSVAAAIAAKMHRDLFTGHEHSLFQRFDVSGKYQCVGLGCMLRPDLIDYKTMRVTTNPEWNPGFVTLIDRQVTIYAKGRYKV